MPALSPKSIDDSTLNSHSCEKDTAVAKVGLIEQGSENIRSELLPAAKTSLVAFDMDTCLAAFTCWLNNAREQVLEVQMTHEPWDSLFSDIRETVHVVSCTENELSGIKKPWGHRAQRVKVIAAWSIDDPDRNFKCDNWRSQMQDVGTPQPEHLLVCQVKESGTGKDFMIVCSFGAFRQSNDGIASAVQGQHCVISCPGHVLPLCFVAITPKGEQPKWRLEHTKVLPLP